jgi:hypothetical protein
MAFQLTHFHHSISVMKAPLLAIFLIAIVAAIPGDGVEGCDGHESRFELMDQLPSLEASVPNGKKYTYGNPSSTQNTTVVSSTWCL